MDDGFNKGRIWILARDLDFFINNHFSELLYYLIKAGCENVTLIEKFFQDFLD